MNLVRIFGLGLHIHRETTIVLAKFAKKGRDRWQFHFCGHDAMNGINSAAEGVDFPPFKTKEPVFMKEGDKIWN